VENVFAHLRWPQTDGQPVCPTCGCQVCYDCRRSPDRARWRCKACRADFSVTSGTLFAWHKLPLRTYLMAIVVFCNEVKGKSMLAFARDIDVQYKTAFVLAHKLREAMAASTRALRIGGDGRTAEVDGAYFGGHRRPENRAADRVDRRLSEPRRVNAGLSWRCASAAGAQWRRSSRPRLTQWRRSGSVLPRAPRCMPMKAPPGTPCTPALRCNGSTIRMASV
jgi:transposase-like protein